jgi:hypothetical protein
MALAICALHRVLVRCGSAKPCLPVVAHLGRFLPRLGPFVTRTAPFLCPAWTHRVGEITGPWVCASREGAARFRSSLGISPPPAGTRTPSGMRAVFLGLEIYCIATYTIGVRCAGTSRCFTALLGRFLPRLGPFAIRTASFFCLEGRHLTGSHPASTRRRRAARGPAAAR